MYKKAQGLYEFAVVAAVVALIAITVAGPMAKPVKQLYSEIFPDSHKSETVESKINIAFANTKQSLGKAANGASEVLLEIYNSITAFSQDPLNKMNTPKLSLALVDLINRIAKMPPGAEKEALLGQLEEMLEEMGADEALVTSCVDSPSSCQAEVESSIESFEQNTVYGKNNEYNGEIQTINNSINDDAHQLAILQEEFVYYSIPRMENVYNLLNNYKAYDKFEDFKNELDSLYSISGKNGERLDEIYDLDSALVDKRGVGSEFLMVYKAIADLKKYVDNSIQDQQSYNDYYSSKLICEAPCSIKTIDVLLNQSGHLDRWQGKIDVQKDNINQQLSQKQELETKQAALQVLYQSEYFSASAE